MKCKECAEMGLCCEMELDTVTVDDTRVKVVMFCDHCDYTALFDSNMCTEFHAGWHDYHGSYWNAIQRLRENNRHKLFWEAVRKWRQVRRDAPEEYVKARAKRFVTKEIRRIHIAAWEAELTRHAMPVVLLDKFANLPENNNNGKGNSSTK